MTEGSFTASLQEKIDRGGGVEHRKTAESCTICTDNYSDFAIFDNCDHTICMNCAEVELLEKYYVPSSCEVEETKPKRCPMCRTAITQWTGSKFVLYYKKHGFGQLNSTQDSVAAGSNFNLSAPYYLLLIQECVSTKKSDAMLWMLLEMFFSLKTNLEIRTNTDVKMVKMLCTTVDMVSKEIISSLDHAGMTKFITTMSRNLWRVRNILKYSKVNKTSSSYESTIRFLDKLISQEMNMAMKPDPDWKKIHHLSERVMGLQIQN